jgi:hypothetical protein
MKTLKNSTTEELLAELMCRELQARPVPLLNPDFSQLQTMIVMGVSNLTKDGYIDGDFEMSVYETAIEAVYGPGFWNWFNNLA